MKDIIIRDLIKLTAPQVKKNSSLDTFYITAVKNDILELEAHLPESGVNKDIDAHLRINNSDKIRTVELSYLGGSPWHWLYPQKSMKIKLKSDELYELERKFILINSPGVWFDIQNFIINELSKESGLITPEYFSVRVFINNKYMGVYVYVSQADEYILRKYKRMPGSIYSCKLESSLNNGKSDLWNNPECWKKISSRNAEQKLFREDIVFFLKSINQQNEIAFYNFVNNYLDKDNYFTSLALDLFLGANDENACHDTIYFDPYKGKYEFIRWDMPSLINSSRKDISHNPLLRRIKLYPQFESERNIIAYNLLKKIRRQEITKGIDYYKDVVWNDLKADINRDTVAYIPAVGTGTRAVSLDEINANIEEKKKEYLKRRNYLENLYEISNVAFKIIEGNNFNTIIFKVNGNSGINLSLTDFFHSISDNDRIKIFEDRNRDGVPDNSDRQIPVKGDIILYPGRKIIPGNARNPESPVRGDNEFENAPLYYPFIITGNVKINKQTHYGVNLVTNARVPVSYEEFGMENEADSIHPWDLPFQMHQSGILSGKIHLDETLVFNKYTEVKILPGTTFIMAPGKSVYFYGKVTAEGTFNKPIRFIAGEKTKPWGNIVIQGKNASGSRFKYCEFSNGSVDDKNLIKYTGQLNIHDLDDFYVSYCKVGKNSIGDDCMHIAYAKGTIENCIFFNAPGDGLDIDIGEVEIKDCLFIRAGNDGLDLMTTKANIINTLFLNCGDKGISIGEWSESVIEKTFYFNCLIGVEIKDKSVVNLKNSFILDSKAKAINLYNKNLHYDMGGTININRVYIYKGKTDISADEKSVMHINKVINNYAPFKEFEFIKQFLTNINDWRNPEEKIKELVF